MKMLLPFRTLLVLATVLALVAARLSAAPEAATLPEKGVNVARPGGGWLNLEAAENRLAVRFFDADKKPVAPDVARGSARVVYPSREDRRVVLAPEGERLVSPAKVRPPLVFRLHLSLYRDDGAAEPAESFVVHYPEKEVL